MDGSDRQRRVSLRLKGNTGGQARVVMERRVIRRYAGVNIGGTVIVGLARGEAKRLRAGREYAEEGSFSLRVGYRRSEDACKSSISKSWSDVKGRSQREAGKMGSSLIHEG